MNAGMEYSLESALLGNALIQLGLPISLSILMTAVASLVTVLTIPFLANLAIDLFTDQSLDNPLRLPVLQTIIMLLGSADIAMPAALYGVLMFVSAGVLVGLGRRHAHVSLRPGRGEIPLHVPENVGFPDDRDSK